MYIYTYLWNLGTSTQADDIQVWKYPVREAQKKTFENDKFSFSKSYFHLKYVEPRSETFEGGNKFQLCEGRAIFIFLRALPLENL